jgi:hypothetical protein
MHGAITPEYLTNARMSASTGCGHAVAYALGGFVPTRRHVHRSKKQHLLRDLVGKREQRRGEFDAKQLGGLEIDDEPEISGSLNR